MTNLAEMIDTLTDENEHTRAALLAASALGGTLGEAYGTILREIAYAQELQGHIEKNQQTLRDCIMREVRAVLVLQGKL